MDIFDDVAAFNELRDNAGAVETLTDPVAEEYNAVYVIRATPSAKLRQVLAAATAALALQKKREGAKIIPLDAEGRRWALTIDGRVRFTGHSQQECKERGDVLLGQRGPDRLAQDAALQRIFR